MLGLLLMMASVNMSQTEEWQVAGRDSLHTNFTEAGPAAPLTQAWVAKSQDPTSSFTNWPVVTGGAVYARSAGGLIAVDAMSGMTRWWRDFQGSNQVAPAVDDKAVYLPLGTSEIAALDRLDGSTLWTFDHQSGKDLEGSPTIHEGRLYFGIAEAKSVIALNTQDGSTVWETATQFEPNSVPAVSDGIVVLPIDEVEGTGRADRVSFLALDSANGKEIWRIDQRESSSSVSIRGGTAFFGGGDQKAHAIDLKTGAAMWSTPVEDKFDPWTMPALAFGDVFLADRVGNVYRLDGDSGERVWIASNTVGTMDQSFPVISGSNLFIGSGAGELYAFDVENGRLLWKSEVSGIVQSGAADEQHFYFGVKLGKDEGLHAYKHDPEGSLIRSPTTQNPLTALFGGLLLFALLMASVVLFARHSAKKSR